MGYELKDVKSSDLELSRPMSIPTKSKKTNIPLASALVCPTDIK